MGQSMRGGRMVVGLALGLLVCRAAAVAQVLSAPSPSNNSTADELNLSGLGTSWDRQSQVTQLPSSPGSFQVRYTSSVSCDSGAFGGARTENMTSDYTLSFTVTAPGAYVIDVDTRRTGDLGAHYDGGITGGSAALSGVTGVQTGGTFVSGTLDLPDPTDCNVGGGTTSSCNQPYNQLATARFSGVSNGVPVSHTLHFTWTQSTFSAAASGHEAAVRLGAQGRDSTNDAALYPGSPSRSPQANDGHFVTVTLSSLCGNGSLDAGEQCDQGPANGAPTSCCTASCQFRASGQLCRIGVDLCDAAESCTGASGACPTDAYAPPTQGCRAASGPCDVAEFCTGFTPSCPPDQVAPTTVVCRAGSAGEVCDQDELCDGVGTSCPADAVQPSGTPCRAAAGVCDVTDTCDGTGKLCPADLKSTAPCRAASGVCDVAESCDGIGNDCPADGFQSASVTCRAAAGVCDVAEHCSGSGANCPADGKSTAVCRAAAGTCDQAESCDGVGNDCPANAVKPSGTTCRAASGTCDVAETCNGSAISCPADGFQPSGTPCPDALFCNGAETCNGAGACVDGPDPCSFICNEGTGAGLAFGCNSTPLGGCRAAGTSLLFIKNNADSSRDKLIWKWLHGQSTSQADLADPRTTATYSLCLYAGASNALVGEMTVPPGGDWTALSSKGFKYFDAGSVQDGAQKILLKGSATNRSKAYVKGRGFNLPDPIDSAALTTPVTVQLINYGAAPQPICFESTFNSFSKSSPAQFKAKTP